MEKRKLMICIIIIKFKNLLNFPVTQSNEDHKNSCAPGSELSYLKKNHAFSTHNNPLKQILWLSF